MENKFLKLYLLVIKAKPRILYSVLIGIGTFLALHGHHDSTRFLMAWSAASATYLVLAFLMMRFYNGRKITNISKYQDDGELLIYIISILTSVVSLIAIFIHVGEVSEIPIKDRVLGALMTGITFFISWMVLHTAYALHYAHAYYANFNEAAEFPPLIFYGNKYPSYSEFFHFSLVIGMTAQTADIIIVNSKIRNLVTAHSLLSFAFNATLLGLTMSLVGNLLAT